MIEFRQVLVVAVGAAIGGVARFVIGQLFVMRFGPGFPWGTMFINVTGSFLIGVVFQLAESRAMGVTPLVRLFAATGILGGYTTFSAFSLEAFMLFDEGGGGAGLFYIIGSVAFGVVAAYAGLVLTRIVVR